ncbi:MAG: glycosyltransferase family 4 protein [Candidatus Tritonobacter lacicola]|nr:glycosyltransferase family 4 protein [Candidatus Tritonobacter lacicola]
MKIVYVTHRYWPYPGGSEKYVQEMSERFVREGDSVQVITTDAWDIEHFFSRGSKSINKPDEVHNGVPIKRVPARKFPFHKHTSRLLSAYPSLGAKALFRRPSPFVPSLSRELKKHCDADIIHSSAFSYDSLMYTSHAFATRHDIPFAITPFVHFGEPREALRISTLLTSPEISVLQRSDLVIAQTNLEKLALCRLPLPPGKIAVLGMGVNPEEVTGGDGNRFRVKHNISPTDTVILHVAEQSYLKGSIHLVEAVKRIKPRVNRIRIVFAGTSMRNFRKYMDIQEKDILDACIFIDIISGQEKKDAFDACDIYAMPSKTDTFGIVYLEAWLAKKPVIGAMAGGVPDVVSDGVDGFLVPYGNIYMLADYLWKLIHNKELRDTMGENGYQKVLQFHTWDKKYNKIKRLFIDLIDRKSSSGKCPQLPSNPEIQG